MMNIMDDKEQAGLLFLQADERGLSEEAAEIYLKYFKGSGVGSDETHPLKDLMNEAGCLEGVKIYRINWPLIRKELVRLLNPS